MGADALAGGPLTVTQPAGTTAMDGGIRISQPVGGSVGNLRATDAVLLTSDAAASKTAPGPSFADALGRALDNLSGALSQADALAAGVAVNRAGVAQAAIARAKADTILEIAAIAAARVSGVITQLLQTQV
jgi:flagellar hook-basal body complex protein FliE